MNADDQVQLRELLSDAERCARLSKWEEEFCDSMRERVLLGSFGHLSDKQRAILDRIEAKVYAT